MANRWNSTAAVRMPFAAADGRWLYVINNPSPFE